MELIPLNTGHASKTEELVINVADLAITSFSAAIPAAINHQVAFYLMIANFAIDEILQDLNLTCIQHRDVPKPGFNESTTFFAFTGAACLFLLIGLTALFLHFRSEAQKEQFYAKGAETSTLLLRMEPPRGSEALIVSNRLHFVVRYGILFLLLANIALFISSNSSVGASVYLVIKAKGENDIKFPSLFDFSLMNSVQDMWNAKVYALSVLIAVFSGIWPYVKLLLMLICWLVPGRLLKVYRRGRILLFLDALGKCSLIDSFVMILMMVAFHFSVSPSDTVYTPPHTLDIQTWVEPHYGFYSFVVATISSLLITHAVVASHRKASDDPVDDVDYINFDDKKSLLAYSRRSGSGGPTILLFSVAPLLLGAIAMVIAGSIIESVEFEFRGAFGYLLKIMQESTTTSYSLLSLGLAIPSSSDTPNSAGTIFIQVTYFLFVFAMPLLYLTLLIAMWIAPLSFRAQRKLLHVTEIVQAWSSLEVFVVAVIAALLELQQFAQFIIGNRCDFINPILEKYGHPILGDDDKCFDVVARLKTGCWVIFCACVVYLIVGISVIRRCHKTLNTRLREINADTAVNN